MANEDLKKKLEVLEISYPGNASRKQLQALIDEAAKLPEIVETAESTQESTDVAQALAEPELEPAEPATVVSLPLVRVKTTHPSVKLNVRKTPNGEVLDTIEYGVSLGVAGDVVDGWLPVYYGDGKAYVMAKFVVANG